MAQVKKIGMAVGTFGVALGIGFVMQNEEVLAGRFGAEAEDSIAPFTTVEDDHVVAAAVRVEDVLAPQTDVMPAKLGPSLEVPMAATAASVALPKAPRVVETPVAPVQLASVDPELLPDVLDVAPIEATVDTVECVPEIMASTGPAATVDIALDAPCHPSTAFTVHHQGMMFTEMTTATGVANFVVPALTPTAVVIVAFANGDGAVATSVIPDFENYDRAVLQWQGEASVMLSAYEDGAVFGDAAHIYSGNPGDIARLEDAEGGYLMSLGNVNADNPLMAEVYTFPSGTISNPADVTLVAEAEITDLNCGAELSAQSIQVAPTGEASALDLTMVMPSCDAVGDFLILQNMFEDLTLAVR